MDEGAAVGAPEPKATCGGGADGGHRAGSTTAWIASATRSGCC